MKRFLYITTICLLYCLFHAEKTQAQAEFPTLSENAQISLMTCGAGSELYSMFGHSALWIQDPELGIDRIYNYGTFDFDDEGFYYKFARGIADYKLSVTSYRGFMQEYISENRTVEMQVLNLTQAEKQKLFAAVEENYKPENRYYRYDFLFLNCSSIVRDRVFDELDNPWELDSTPYDQSFRDLLQPMINDPWITLGINFLLGHKTDLMADNWQRMFLPAHMRDQFAQAQIQNRGPLAPATNTLFLSTAPPPVFNEKMLDAPLIIALLLFLITGLLTRKQWYHKKWNNWLDAVLFFISGLAGLLLLFMWFFSEHVVTHQNVNLLWAFPLHLFMVVWLWFPGLKPLIKRYAQIMLVLAALFILLAIIGFQHIPLALFLLSGILMLRLFRLAFLPEIPNQIDQ